MLFVRFDVRRLRKIFNDQFSRKFQAIERSARRKLLLLDQSVSLNDLAAAPGNRLEALAGDRAGQHSIRINDQFRLCFTWDAPYANNVEIVAYHHKGASPK